METVKCKLDNFQSGPVVCFLRPMGFLMALAVSCHVCPDNKLFTFSPKDDGGLRHAFYRASSGHMLLLTLNTLRHTDTH